MPRTGTHRLVCMLATMAAACAFAAFPLTATAARAVPSAPRAGDPGIFEDVQYLTGQALTSRLDAYAALGVHIVRFQLIWDNVQHTSGATYDWSNYDVLVRGIVARGMQPLAVIDTSPAWARPAWCDEPTCAPSGSADYARFAGAAAARYAPLGLHDWEIWNEPNNAIFWKPNPDPVAYAALLRAAYPAIKAADPQSVVISGGMAPVPTTSDATGLLTVDPVDFLATAYANGVAGSFDALGAHPYTFPALPGRNAFGWGMLSSGGGTTLRKLMLDNGDGAKQIWATEFGAPTVRSTTGVSDAQQTQLVTRAYAMWSRLPWAGPLIWYSYRDRGTDPSDRENFFGLVRADGTRKPAYFAYQRVARSSLARLTAQRAR